MENLLEAVLAIMGLCSGFYILGMMLMESGPRNAAGEPLPQGQSHAIHTSLERLAA